jgi:uncharacterized protein YdhG (YjbR/CyaY superfamily)
MAKTDYQSVDEYIAAHPADVQPVLKRVRRTIRKALPRAEEAISYQIPAYKLDGSAALYFAGWKQHVSLYPASDRMVAALGAELAPYRISKGTIRFPLSEPLPLKLIERIARFRAQESAERVKGKAAKGKASGKKAGRKKPAKKA